MSLNTDRFAEPTSDDRPRALFERQKAAAGADPFPSAIARIGILRRLEELLRQHADDLAQAVSTDFGGRSHHETQLLEIFPSLEALRHARAHVKAWMRPERRATSLWFLPGRSRVLRQPLGVVGIVVPWNYPIYLAVGPLAAAMAAGNRAMVKMSETTPTTGALLARLVAERFPELEITIVNGGPDVAQAFCAMPFDHLLFTGSTAVGRHVMHAAADNLTPVTLELGGKSPAIVGRGFPIEEAASRILYGKCLNAGQTCIAPDYALVPQDRIDAFVNAARRTVAALYPTLAANADYTAIVDERHRVRLDNYLEDARGKGAQIIEINPAGEDLRGTGKRAPTLLLGVSDEMTIMREEIFGPLLPVVPCRGLDDAIAWVNARPRPLALYLFERDRASIDRVVTQTISGGVTVNETILHIAQDDLPFGGVGPSGMGQYHGRDGFATFSKAKAVFFQSRFNGLKLFRAPYGKRFEALIGLLLR